MGRTTPAIKFLFQVEDLPLLCEELVDQFDRTVVRFLYAAKRARPDIQVAVAFLWKHVKTPNTGDWNKLRRLVRGTTHIPLMLGWEE